jgi:gliding motility-associated lipoprotein GldD
MMKLLKSKLFLYSVSFTITIVMVSCEEENNFPHPLGYYRIYLPKEREYKAYSGDCSYSFEHPNYSTIVVQDNCNNNLYFPKFNATVYGTFLKLTDSPNNDFFYHSEFSRKLAYKHRIKADRIEEETVFNDSINVYGVVYTIDGNVASNYQFFLTDSNDNFYRGSLYFNIAPNTDSIKPVLNYIRDDINHLIETFSWK